MYCTNCGAKVPKSAKICGNCGQPLKAVGANETPIERAAPPAPPKRLPAAVRPQPRPARRLPQGAWAVVAGLIVLASAGFWLETRGPDAAPVAAPPADEIEASSLVEEAAPPAVDIPNPTEGDPSGENFNDLISDSETARPPAGTSITLTYGWGVKETSYASDYLDAIAMEVWIDDTKWPEPMAYWSSVQERDDIDGDGIADFAVIWKYSLGNLAPGNYKMVVTITYLRPIQDGFDLDGDGNLDIYDRKETFTRTIIVE